MKPVGILTGYIIPRYILTSSYRCDFHPSDLAKHTILTF